MSDRDWFRCTTWSTEHEARFIGRLARARPQSRAQYLRIQGVTLVESMDPGAVRAGERLLRQVLTDYPDAVSEAVSVWASLGALCERRGQLDDALEMYRLGRLAEQQCTTSANATLHYARVAVMLQKFNLAREVLPDLEGKVDKVLQQYFPDMAMQWLLIKAAVARWQGDTANARLLATQGLREAAKTRSGLARHPDLGLVNETHAAQLEMLRSLAQ